MIKPNFFIIGAPKCGTTALSEYLREHPSLFLSTPKEPNYFNFDLAKHSKMSEKTYLSLYLKADPNIHKAVGEASSGYLFSKLAVEEIIRFNPDAKFIVMLRNPVELVQALHSEMIFRGLENILDFEKAWKAQDDRRTGKNIPLLCFEPKAIIYSDLGKLGDQLERVFSHARKENVKVIIHDDFISDPGKIYNDVLAFLKLPSDGRSDFPKRNENKALIFPWLQPIVILPLKIERLLLAKFGIVKSFPIFRKLSLINSKPAKRKPLRAEFLAEITNFYNADVLKISDISNRDLSQWSRIGANTENKNFD